MNTNWIVRVRDNEEEANEEPASRTMTFRGRTVVWGQGEENNTAEEDHSNDYYCGICGGWVPISSYPCGH